MLKQLMLWVAFIICSSAGAQTTADKLSPLVSKINLLNTQTELALIQGNTDTLMQYYHHQAVCMPEYHQALYTIADIKKFYADWFNQVNIRQFRRTIFDVQTEGEYIVESGNYATTFTPSGQASFAYNGKYITIWKNENNKLKRIGEIWGSTNYIDRAQLAHWNDSAIIKPPVLSAAITSEIDKRNAVVCKAVKERDGITLATLYTDDAIYMPYYSPMLAGIDSIKAYYVQHENPDVKIDTVYIKASRVLKAGNSYIVNGWYVVKWQAGNNSGIVTGKSINVWIRKPGGELMLFRQMVNHD